jgi:hypothetical protein
LTTNPYANSITADGGVIYWCETGSGRIQTNLGLSTSSVAYFPLTAGTQWTFQQEGQPNLTYTVLAQAETVNNVQTRIIEHSDGYRQYFTNDDHGIRLHREYDPAENATYTFSPHLVYAKSTMTLGETVASGGKAEIQFSGLGTYYNLSYTAQSTMEGFETLALPLGRLSPCGFWRQTTPSWTMPPPEPISTAMPKRAWKKRSISCSRFRECGSLERMGPFDHGEDVVAIQGGDIPPHRCRAAVFQQPAVQKLHLP